ncbi:MAG: type II secretion system protein [Ruminococcus sp.]|nr:type II secretion system protein [Ruminococcus sp.]
MDMKKKLKGFTLIELIIVLAIFGIILTLVLSFIDPVAKVMTTTSTRERTAAYADNISEYIDNSLHYSRFIRVYNGGFCDKVNTDQVLDADFAAAERKAAQLLVDDMLNDAVDSNGQPIKGNVRVMKFVNTPVGGLQEGQIYETVYEFTAGASVKKQKLDASNNPVKDEHGNFVFDTITIDTTAISDTAAVNNPVINPEHFEDYSYYYNLGLFTLDAINDPENYSAPDGSEKSYEAKPREYYSRLNPIRNVTLNSDHSLCINVVSYAKKIRNGAVEFDNKEKALAATDGGGSEEVTVFKSPAHLNSASMALINVMSVDNASELICVRPNRDEATGAKKDGFKPVYQKDAGEAYSQINASYSEADGLTDNIYIVYIMPEEIFDTTIVYN